jgi:hypothetical protein
MWLNPEEDRVLLWDYGQAAPCLSTTKAKELLNLAMKESLSFEKLELLKQSLQRDPQLTQIVSPNKLSDLIERNKILAAEVLLQFMSTPQIGQYVSNFHLKIDFRMMHFLTLVFIFFFKKIFCGSVRNEKYFTIFYGGG